MNWNLLLWDSFVVLWALVLGSEVHPILALFLILFAFDCGR